MGLRQFSLHSSKHHPRKNYGILTFFFVFSVFTTSQSEQLPFSYIKKIALQQFGDKGLESVTYWEKLFYHINDQVARTKLVMVNDFFNQRIQASSDLQIWRQSDYWATPLETLGKGRGDCEDFAIAKYMTLLAAGLPVDKLRLVYVKASRTPTHSQAHMVLAYYPTHESVPLILDNLSLEIMPASKRKDLKPIFSFNSQGLWLDNKNPNKSYKNMDSTRFSHWKNVLLKMKGQGLEHILRSPSPSH